MRKRTSRSSCFGIILGITRPSSRRIVVQIGQTRLRYLLSIDTFFFTFSSFFLCCVCSRLCVVYKTVYHFTAMSYFCAAYRSKQRPSLHTSKWNKHSSCIRMRWDHDYLVDSVEWLSQNKFLFLLCCVLLTCFPRASLSTVNLTALMIFA